MLVKYLRRNGNDSLPIACCIIDDDGKIGISFPQECDIKKTLEQRVSIKKRLHDTAMGRLQKFKSSSLIVSPKGGVMVYQRRVEDFPEKHHKKTKPRHILVSSDKVIFILACIDEHNNPPSNNSLGATN